MNVFGINISKEIYMPIVIILIAILTERILKLLIKKTLNPNKQNKKVDVRKLNTLNSLLSNIIRYVIWIIALFLILGVFGINTAAIITGLGVASLVIGLAFQDILKDILAGISILFENLFAVGDYVKIGDFSGNVIFLGLKTTKVKALTGEIKMFSNRNITEIINYSMDNILVVIDIPVSYETNLDHAEKILKITAAKLEEQINDIKGTIDILGVQELADSSVVFRISTKCKISKKWELERVLKKEFKMALDKNGIKIPYPQLEVHNEK